MTPFANDTIIVPWDFSDMSREALKKAVEIAGGATERIEVVHVTPYPSTVEPSIVWGTYTEEEISAKLIESFRKEVGDEYQDLNFTARFGDPGAGIAKFAESKNAGLVVISSHGRRGIPWLLLGSVAERVVRLSPCPVLVLREKKE